MELLIFILSWIIIGFISFLIEVRQEKYMTFSGDTKSEFMCSLLLGYISFIIIVKPFKKLMEYIMKLVQKRQ
jgi:hypothetical protein